MVEGATELAARPSARTSSGAAGERMITRMSETPEQPVAPGCRRRRARVRMRTLSRNTVRAGSASAVPPGRMCNAYGVTVTMYGYTPLLLQ